MSCWAWLWTSVDFDDMVSFTSLTTQFLSACVILVLRALTASFSAGLCLRGQPFQFQLYQRWSAATLPSLFYVISYNFVAESQLCLPQWYCHPPLHDSATWCATWQLKCHYGLLVLIATISDLLEGTSLRITSRRNNFHCFPVWRPVGIC